MTANNENTNLTNHLIKEPELVDDDGFEDKEFEKSERENKFEKPQRSHRVSSIPKMDHLKQAKIEQ